MKILLITYLFYHTGDGPLTLFAPTNDAFDKLPAGKYSDLLSNTTALQGWSATFILTHKEIFCIVMLRVKSAFYPNVVSQLN